MTPPLRIGPIEISPPIVLAPMSGVTNRTLRALYKPFGFGLTVTEFVSSNALQYGGKRTMEMIDQHGVEKPVSTQLWGNDPQIMATAANLVRECGADIVDINFGCPAPKVTKTEGGSACLRDVDRCEAIMKAVVDAVDCPVTMKMRLGWTEADLVFVEVAKRAQAVGVQALTLHARTAKQFYKGSADWSKIAELKRAVDIPVIGNGDLADPYDAMQRMRESGVDGVMLGRATLGNPWLVSRLRALMADEEPAPVPGAPERLRFAVHHYLTMVEEWGEPRAVPQMRKHLGYYLKGFAGASALRERLMRTETAAETLAILKQTIAQLEAREPELAVA
ncbi:tRNA dihydrouridine synthase DusB [Vulcanimicrobium alpinum]|uniref:tRNA dihydrouridine synthase DusB n=1 Tax=Vulcanimicrobium alpinum TaxID=3016050 RepID=UPI00295F0D4F|nr:tRNA dihydrouridine synthase DusB [Vulcanimicrobium alpinum]